VDAADLDVRNATYRTFVDAGRAPAPEDVARAAGVSTNEVRAAWRRLHDEHAIVLDAGGAIRMAHPFSGVPTDFRVEASGRSWFANCAWDAIGICAALGCDGDIETTCADCASPIGLAIRDTRPVDPTLLFHSLVPARRWWDDIVFT
jgi:hypothetical protein